MGVFLRNNITKSIICACAVGAVGAGSISANFINLRNIQSVCPNVNQVELDKKLREYTYFTSGFLPFETYKEKIIKEIENLVVSKGASNVKNNDIYAIFGKYFVKGGSITIKFKDEKGEYRLMYDPFSTDGNDFYVGKYEKIDPFKLQESLSLKVRRGTILDLDAIVNKIIKEKAKKGIYVGPDNITNSDVESWIDNNIDTLSFYSDVVLQSTDRREYEQRRAEFDKGESEGFDSGYFIGAAAGVFSVFASVAMVLTGVYGLSRLNGMEDLRNMFNNAKEKISNIFNKANNNANEILLETKNKAIDLFGKAKVRTGNFLSGAKIKAGDLFSKAKDKANDIFGPGGGIFQ